MNESTVNNPILKENESTRAILAGVDTGVCKLHSIRQ